MGFTVPPSMRQTIRYPSYLISCSQPSPVGTASTRVASVGVSVAGSGAARAPARSANEMALPARVGAAKQRHVTSRNYPQDHVVIVHAPQHSIVTAPLVGQCAAKRQQLWQMACSGHDFGLLSQKTVYGKPPRGGVGRQWQSACGGTRMQRIATVNQHSVENARLDIDPFEQWRIRFDVLGSRGRRP